MPTTTSTLSRSPPTAHPRNMTNTAASKPPSKIPLAYPAPYSTNNKGGTTTSSKTHSPPSTHTSAVPSLVSDSGSSSGSGSGRAAEDADLLDLLDLKLSHSVKPEPLDRGVVRQAQVSGELNAKQRELAELQALAQRRLKGARANFADGQKAAKEVKRDLEWTQRKVNTLKTKTERKYPKEYRKAHQRYPSPEN